MSTIWVPISMSAVFGVITVLNTRSFYNWQEDRMIRARHWRLPFIYACLSAVELVALIPLILVCQLLSRPKGSSPLCHSLEVAHQSLLTCMFCLLLCRVFLLWFEYNWCQASIDRIWHKSLHASAGANNFFLNNKVPATSLTYHTCFIVSTGVATSIAYALVIADNSDRYISWCSLMSAIFGLGVSVIALVTIKRGLRGVNDAFLIKQELLRIFAFLFLYSLAVGVIQALDLWVVDINGLQSDAVSGELTQLIYLLQIAFLLLSSFLQTSFVVNLAQRFHSRRRRHSRHKKSQKLKHGSHQRPKHRAPAAPALNDVNGVHGMRGIRAMDAMGAGGGGSGAAAHTPEANDVMELGPDALARSSLNESSLNTSSNLSGIKARGGGSSGGGGRVGNRREQVKSRENSDRTGTTTSATRSSIWSSKSATGTDVSMSSTLMRKTNKKMKRIRMIDALRDKMGFDTFIQHCANELNANNILFLIEVAQYKANLVKYNVPKQYTYQMNGRVAGTSINMADTAANVSDADSDGANANGPDRRVSQLSTLQDGLKQATRDLTNSDANNNEDALYVALEVRMGGNAKMRQLGNGLDRNNKLRDNTADDVGSNSSNLLGFIGLKKPGFTSKQVDNSARRGLGLFSSGTRKEIFAGKLDKKMKKVDPRAQMFEYNHNTSNSKKSSKNGKIGADDQIAEAVKQLNELNQSDPLQRNEMEIKSDAKQDEMSAQIGANASNGTESQTMPKMPKMEAQTSDDPGTAPNEANEANDANTFGVAKRDSVSVGTASNDAHFQSCPNAFESNDLPAQQPQQPQRLPSRSVTGQNSEASVTVEESERKRFEEELAAQQKQLQNEKNNNENNENKQNGRYDSKQRDSVSLIGSPLESHGDTVLEMTVSPEWLYDFSQHLFDKYIKRSADLRVNIKAPTYMKLRELFDARIYSDRFECDTSKVIDYLRESLVPKDKPRNMRSKLVVNQYLYHIFDTAYHEVWVYLRSKSWKYFKKTKEYSKLNSQLMKRIKLEISDKMSPNSIKLNAPASGASAVSGVSGTGVGAVSGAERGDRGDREDSNSSDADRESDNEEERFEITNGMMGSTLIGAPDGINPKMSSVELNYSLTSMPRPGGVGSVSPTSTTTAPTATQTQGTV